MPPSIRASKKLSYQKLVYLSVYLSVCLASSVCLSRQLCLSVSPALSVCLASSVCLSRQLCYAMLCYAS